MRESLETVKLTENWEHLPFCQNAPTVLPCFTLLYTQLQAVAEGYTDNYYAAEIAEVVAKIAQLHAKDVLASFNMVMSKYEKDPNVGMLNCAPIFFACATYSPKSNLCTLQDSSTTPIKINEFTGKNLLENSTKILP
jgi:hypothetical protein